MPDPWSIYYLFTEWGLKSLEQRLIAPDQVKKMTDYISNLFTEPGYQALQQKLITPDQVRDLRNDIMEYLFTASGRSVLSGLSTGDLTVADINSMTLHQLEGYSVRPRTKDVHYIEYTEL